MRYPSPPKVEALNAEIALATLQLEILSKLPRPPGSISEVPRELPAERPREIATTDEIPRELATTQEMPPVHEIAPLSEPVETPPRRPEGYPYGYPETKPNHASVYVPETIEEETEPCFQPHMRGGTPVTARQPDRPLTGDNFTEWTKTQGP